MTGFKQQISSDLLESLHELALGVGVKRSMHTLVVDGKDYTNHFIQILQSEGFIPTTVRDIQIEPGERIPAFYIENSVAYFGWVFYEKYFENKTRKLWGSVVRNKKGDWKIQISPKRHVTIYAHLNDKHEMDLDHPTDW